MSATHRIPYVRLPGVDENDFRCYPRRGDSLSFYSTLYDRRFGFGKGWFEIPPDEAAAYMAERLGITPEREGAGNPTSAGAPAASPSGSSRCPAVAEVLSTTSSLSSLTGMSRRSSRIFAGRRLRG
jgi:hypothetical protein